MEHIFVLGDLGESRRLWYLSKSLLILFAVQACVELAVVAIYVGGFFILAFSYLARCWIGLAKDDLSYLPLEPRLFFLLFLLSFIGYLYTLFLAVMRRSLGGYGLVVVL